MATTKAFKGDLATRKVTMDGVELDINKSRNEVFDYGAPDFSWGHYGPGAAQLAASILLELTDEMSVIRVYQRFKQDVIRSLPADEDFSISIARVRKWLRACNARDSKEIDAVYTPTVISDYYV